MVRVSLAVALAGALLLPAVADERRLVTSGMASWYGPAFENRRMANGQRFHANRMTAASRTIALGTWVLVRNTRNGRSVIVQITDRGPYIHNRIIDLSLAAARQIGSLSSGVVPVTVAILPLPFTLYSR